MLTSSVHIDNETNTTAASKQAKILILVYILHFLLLYALVKQVQKVFV